MTFQGNIEEKKQAVAKYTLINTKYTVKRNEN